MRYQSLPIASTYQRYRALAKKVRSMFKNGTFKALSGEKQKELLSRLKRLYLQLSKVIAGNKLKGALASGALILSLGLGTADAQTFGTPQVQPFNLDAGVEAYLFPQFVDIDDDGDYDVFTAGYLDYQGNKILFFENTGTPEAPNFAAPVENPFGIPALEETTLLSFGDLDGDGDFDFIVGQYDYSTSITYLENTGTSASPAFGSTVTSPFGMGEGEDFSAPVLADLDGDGDLDLLFTDYDDNTEVSIYKYQENEGTATNPSFGAVQINPFGLGAAADQTDEALVPSLVDIDNDGDLDILNGGVDYIDLGGNNYRAFVSFIENTGTAMAPAFQPEVDEPFNIIFPDFSYSSFNTLADLDADGDADLLSFTYLYDPVNETGSNLFVYFENESVINSVDAINKESSLELFPTTTQSQVNWRLESSTFEAPMTLQLYSTLGQLINQYSISNAQGSIDMANLSPGTYLFRMLDAQGEAIATKQIIKQK
jgi:hypothetical protein